MGIEEIRAIKSGSEEKRDSRKNNNGVSGDAKKDAAKKEAWFSGRRKEMTGTCQCGCGLPSSKNSVNYFRHSAAHIFPKNKFKSIALHPVNSVERAFFGGCHTNMDERGMDKWPNFADWPDIVRKFYILEKELTPEEKTFKFYKNLKLLVEKNPAA